MCQLATGAGAVVCSTLQRYLKTINETPGRMALAGHFAMIPHLRTYYFDLSGNLQALLIFRAGLLPKVFLLSTHLLIILYLMPNGYLTPVGGRAVLTILSGSAHILCIVIFEIGAFFPYSHRMGHGVCASTWALAGGGHHIMR